MLALVSFGAVAQTTIETPRTIRVVTDNVYAPYSFQSDEGKLQGIVIDQWLAWEKKTGIKVEIQAMDWGEALRRMRAGEFDVIDSIVETPERREYFDFTPAYTPIEASVFFRNDISGITDIASLKGFPVGVKAGDQHLDKLKANGVTTVILFQNYDAMIDAAKQHKINVFVIDNPSALYLLNKAGIEGEFRHSVPMFHDELRRAVRKGDTALLRTVSEGFAAIEPDELNQINEKWFGRTINRIGQYLTYAGYTVVAALLIIAGLTVWNRTLRKKVLQRTAALGESEQRFRRLVELMPVAVYVCDTSGIIQIYNHRAVELWGREPKLGDTAQRYCASLRLYSPEGKLVPHEESKMAEALRTGVPAHDLEVVIERPDGSCITTLVNIAPLRNGKGELVGAMNCFQDITERKLAEKDLEEAHRQLKILSRRRVKVQEEERRHLARELHDEIGQALTGAKINLDAATKESDGAKSKRIDETAAILEKLLGQVRQISLDLRPSMLDDLGLVPALRSLLDQQGRHASVAVHLSAKNVPENLDAEIQTTCFRIGQEAITNAVRHANATRIDVDLRCENGNLRLQVRDNGRGFDADAVQAQAVGLGLVGIKERAVLVDARAKIISSPNNGTTVEVSLPLMPLPEREGRVIGK
ncbi:MAG TPA: transporter substrate-binding domain-containing protein [Chthoniobacterales bacterium]|nr:transporter substrate-binding domain-containing protein [Chthoniobacterales bacterium]